ncbi:MAG: phospholipase D-like domain-containing protein [Thermodesulfovibrionales bacterium]
MASGRQGFTAAGIEGIYGGSFIGGNRVELLERGREAFGRIFDAVRRARRIVCLEFYIFRNDETGEELAGILKQKASQGVQVYILYDHLGSFGTPRRFWKDLRRAGVKARASHAFRWTAPGRYQHRDHRKLVVVDGHTAFTGGLNIANEYRGLHIRKKEPWRDTGVMVKGPAASALMETFMKAWVAFGGEPIEATTAEAPAEGDLPVMPIFAHSSRGRRGLRRLLYYSINHSAKSICLTTAYFTPSRRMIETLEAAVARGVSVRLLVPGISDVPAAYYAARAFFHRLLRAGVEIYEYQGMVLHAKTYIFDGVWSIAGSANLDFQSLRWNDEGNIGILDEDFAARMTAVFEEDVSKSLRITMEDWSRRPLWAKIKERFFSLFRRRL